MRVRINGRTLPKARSLNRVLTEAREALDGGKVFEVEVEVDGWVKATKNLSFGRVAFANGKVLDGLDDGYRLNPTWR